MKRFYREVTTGAEGAAEGEGWRVLLDGRGIKTVGGRAQLVPTRALAEALAEEWAAQGDEINPAGFTLRDMADYALDVVAPDRAVAVSGLLPYAETDTLCYRADPDEPLYRRQHELWEPLLTSAEGQYGVSFRRVSGIMHRPQPEETLAALTAHLAGLDDFALAGLRTLASLAASLSIGLMALNATAATADALWDAASLEEEWQAKLWGRDPDAEALRARRREAFLAATRFAALARQG